MSLVMTEIKSVESFARKTYRRAHAHLVKMVLGHLKYLAMMTAARRDARIFTSRAFV